MDLNDYNIGGAGSTNHHMAKAAAEAAKRESQALSTMAGDMAILQRAVARVDDELAVIKGLLYRSYRIQERQLLTLNNFLPESERTLSIGSDVLKARHLLGYGLLEKISESGLKAKFKALAKKCHPDVNDGESSEEFLELEAAYKLLLTEEQNDVKM